MPQSIPSAFCRASSGHPPLGVGWEQLYQSAVLELNEDRFPERVAVARSAILDRVEEILTTSRTDEHRALRDAPHFLLLLEEVAAKQFAHRAAA